MKLKKILSLTLTGCMALTLLTACGSGTGSTQAKAGSTAAAKAGSTAASGGSSAGTSGKKELKVGIGIGWDTLTPFRGNIGNDAEFAHVLYESLAVQDSTSKFVPCVAKSWNSADGGTTYDVEIYDYVKDSQGNSIKASDIVWFIQEAQKAAQKPIFSQVASVEAAGDYKFTVKMKKSMVGSIENLLVDTFVISKSAYEASSDKFASNVVSTSPYLMKQFVSGSSISFEKRSDYWQKPELTAPTSKANVDKITYKIITEASQMGISLETGDIDIARRIDPNTGKQFEKNDKYKIVMGHEPHGYQLFFSGDPSKAVNSLELRQAICYCIDSQGVIDGALAGYGTVMHDVCAEGLVGYDEAWNSEDYYNYNVEKAKELIAKSGYKGEKLSLLSTSSTTFQRVAQIMQGYMQAVGINCTLDIRDNADYTASRLDGKQYDIVINHVGSTSGYLAATWSIRFDSHAYNTGDATSRHDDKMDELLYKTWTLNGYTKDNINEVHKYLKDNAIAYGMAQPQVMDIYNSKIGMTKEVLNERGQLEITACEFQ